ncbi:ankyrin repeat domain-containing protein [Mycobacterium sp. ACS4331]|uniref:ankyrin repeat domain-containing protein n=1 Tax=Mycobacterium sp. ACS4331 TaxID=1834121 RepID=UPI0018D3F218|nr:ankyrin repeat domain-containing protein [Mycobacterium sp. ACS4331]
MERNSGNMFSYDALRGRERRELAELVAAHGGQLDDKDADGKTVVHCAVDANDIDVVEVLLQCGAAVEARDRWGNTALWRAVYQLPESADMVAALLDAGADPEAANNHGATPRQLATKYADEYPTLGDLVERMGTPVDADVSDEVA